MERKRMIEIGVAIVILLALLGVIFWMTRENTAQQIEEEKNTTLPTANTTPAPKPTYDPEDVPKAQEVSAGTVARTFVERVGSYSSESDFQNIDDVLGLVTTRLGAQLEREAKQARRQEPGGEGGYYGVSTSYLGAKTTQETEASMTLMVQTQREEAFGSPGNEEIRYQAIEVVLVQEGGVWKVDAYTWQD